MHPSKPEQTSNNPSGRASLLLPSSNPKVVDSSMRKGVNSVSYSDDDLPEDNAINFIKPQNEIFKKLDGKIQKIVAAHSTMNKMYALNDFSGVGPKKPMELPPQLPRPPPWVPKVSSDYNCSQWAEDALNTSNRSSLSIDLSESSSRQGSSLASLNRVPKINSGQLELKPQFIRAPALTIDSAISKLHQRRQQLQQQRPQHISAQQLRVPAPNPQPPRLSTQARLLQQAHELQQQLRAAAAQQKNQQVDPSITAGPTRVSLTTSTPSTSRSEPSARVNLARKSIPLGALLQMQKKASEQQTGVTISPSLTPDEKRRFQNELINIFRQEIAAVTKLAKLKFNPQTNERTRNSDPRSLLIKKSPQSLFNTIRRETSLLLKRGDLQQTRPSTSSVSLLNNRGSAQQTLPLSNRNKSIVTEPLKSIPRPQILRYHTVKVVMPPSEFHKHTCTRHSSGKEDDTECRCYDSKADTLDMNQWLPSRRFSVQYQTLQLKLSRLKFFPRRDEYNRKRGYCVSMTPADARRRKSPQKSLDKIVDRLQAKCLSTSCSPVQGSKSLLQSVSSSPIPSHASRETTPSPPSSPRPIPVFRATATTARGGNYLGNNSSSRIVNPKSKKAKRLHNLGLRLNNYLDRENPTPATEKLTVEQFAKCLNLVRTNDASLKRHQEKLLQSEMKWRMPVGDRPLRLRRLRGERVHMPASASYRATRRVGLQ